MMGLKWGEILLILFVFMLFFGATRVPQLGSSLGAAIRNFKKSFAGEEDEKAEDKQLPPNQNQPSITAQDKSGSKHS